MPPKLRPDQIEARKRRAAYRKRAREMRNQDGAPSQRVAKPDPHIRAWNGIPIKKTLGVFGTPCGGTSYTAQRLYAAGYEISHERMGPEGIVCGWTWFSLQRCQREHFDFKLVWRVIRHPLSVLETLPTFNHRLGRVGQPPWKVPEDEVLGALIWWVKTHEGIPLDTPLLRVDNFEEDFPALLEAMRTELGPRESRFDAELVTRHSKLRRWPRMSWAELEQLSERYTARARTLVRHFRLSEK